MSGTEIYDFAVLGGGSGGYAGARTASELKLKTVVIDGAAELGGLCILRGCMPSKTLIESANRSLSVRYAARFGVHASAGEVDTTFVRDRKRVLIKDFASYRQGQLHDGRFDLMQGNAVFLASDDPDLVRLEVTLGDGTRQQVLARTVLIATGSSIQTPPLPGLEEVGYWDSDTALDAADIPASFIVLGGGAIALEMAHYFEGIGRKVTIVQRNPRLLKEMDADVSHVISHSFQNRGMHVFTGTKIDHFEKTATGKAVFFQHEEKEELVRVEAAEILVALGRTPNSRQLRLDAVKVKVKDSGQVEVSETQQSSHPRIFAAGDVCGPLEVVHLAILQGETSARNAAQLLAGEALTHTMDYRGKLFGVFTEPQAAAAGLSEAEVKQQGRPYLVASYPFDDHGKSIVMDATEGFVKLIADPETGLLLGGSVVGPEASELIHEISVALHFNATAAQLAAVPHYHPTLSEIWTYPAEELAEMIKFEKASNKSQIH